MTMRLSVQTGHAAIKGKVGQDVEVAFASSEGDQRPRD